MLYFRAGEQSYPIESSCPCLGQDAKRKQWPLRRVVLCIWWIKKTRVGIDEHHHTMLFLSCWQVLNQTWRTLHRYCYISFQQKYFASHHKISQHGFDETNATADHTGVSLHSDWQGCETSIPIFTFNSSRQSGLVRGRCVYFPDGKVPQSTRDHGVGYKGRNLHLSIPYSFNIPTLDYYAPSLIILPSFITR